MSYTSYKTTFRNDEKLSCWCCGEEIEEATLIEWQRGFEKEILCDACLGQLYRNEKNIKILAVIWK